MKRFTAIVLAVFMMLCSLNLSFASGDLKLDFNNAQLSGLTLEGGEIKNIERKNYLYFPGVDLTGINSVTVRAYNKISGNVNGETLLVLIDSHTDGKMIGSVTLSEVGEDVSVTASLTPTSGKHDLYFYCLYGKGTRNECSIKEITLSENTYNHDNKSMQVSDSFIIDNYSDTWAAVDDMGRAVATYEEVGGVKTDGRTVGMLYWNWFHDAKNTKRAHVISDVISEKPEAKEIYTDPVWDVRGRFYWAEPLFGFYNSYDYWVYKKHAEMLAIAGVDVIFFDYTNGGRDYIPTLNVLAEAFREIKAKGVKVPKISAMMTLSGDKSDAFRGLSAIYYNCFKLNDYSDLWYMKDGKPFLYANANYENAVPDVEEGNNFEGNLIKEIGDFFTVTPHGSRDKDSGDDSWMWLENYPQVLRDVDKETGRVGFVAVGCAINESTVFGGSVTGVFSDPYNKGRGYSEAFGEDYSENGKRMAYFFREQSALALMAEPEFMMVDGWNEWTAERNPTWGTFTNAFCDCFDEENSRDFEPTKGSLKDDYYLLLCDLVRKYKGVRPAPVASGMKTIDISGNINEWDGVLPYFINSYQDYERDADGYGKAKTDETWHYTTKVVNSIKGAKLIDGDRTTNWHSYYKAEGSDIVDQDVPPYEIEVILPSVTEISGVTLVPRTEVTGLFLEVDLYVSDSDEGEYFLIKDGMIFENRIYDREIPFTANIVVKKIKIVATSTVGGFGTLSEIELMEKDLSKESVSFDEYAANEEANRMYKVDTSNAEAIYDGENWFSHTPDLAIDGASSTYWQSEELQKGFAAVLDVDLQKVYRIKEIDYTPRQSDDLHGHWLGVGIYTSKDGVNWTMVKNVTFEKDLSVKKIVFDEEIETRYFEFEIYDYFASRVSAAEISFLQTKEGKDASLMANTEKYILKIGSKEIAYEKGTDKGVKEIDVAPFITNGSTMIPLRGLIEEMGGKITWDGETQTIGVDNGKYKITLQICNHLVYVEDPVYGSVRYTLLNYPIISENRTFIPVRFVSEQLGYNVSWDGATGTVTISK